MEAINENERLKKIIEELMAQEILFLQQCFAWLEKHHQLPEGKDPSVMAESLYWMLQGTEMKLFLGQQTEPEEDFMNIYRKTITDFFSII